MSNCLLAGWAGFVSTGGATLPAKNFSANKVVFYYDPTLIGNNIIYSSSIQRSAYNYGKASSHFEAELEIEVFATGTYGAACKSLIQAAIQGLDAQLVFSPSGGSAIGLPGNVTGRAYIDSMTIKGNNQGLVTANFKIQSTDGAVISATPTQLQFESLTAQDSAQSPLAWYATQLTVSGSNSDKTIANNQMDWSITIDNDTSFIYGLNGLIKPVDIRIGDYRVTGSFSYYDSSESFTKDLAQASMNINLGSLMNLKSDVVVFSNNTIPNTGSNNLVTNNVTFECYGSQNNPSLYIG